MAARTAWDVDGVSVITELSTSGELVDDSGTAFIPFVDSNGDGIADGWVNQSPGPGVPKFKCENLQQTIWTTETANNDRGDLAYTARLVIQQGKQYRLALSYRKYESAGAQAQYSRCELSYYDSADALIFPGVFQIFQNANTPTSWTNISSIITPPVNAAYAIMRISAWTVGSAVGIITGSTFADLAWTVIGGTTPVLTWRNVSCDVKSMTIRHGRSRFTDRYDVGTISVSLANADGEYAYRPDHPFGLHPGRILRVTAKYGGITYPMFFGIIDSITDGYAMDGSQVVIFVANDATTVASNTEVPNVTGVKNQLSGERINNLLDIIGYFNRRIDVGQFNQQPITQSGRTVRDEMGVGSDSEGGNFYAERDGTIVFRDRTWETYDSRTNTVQANVLATIFENQFYVIGNTPTVAGAPTICANELVTDWSLARVINEVTLANRGGSAQSFVDVDSRRALGPRSYTRMDFVNVDSSTLPIRANDYLVGSSDAVLRLNSLSYNASVAKTWPFTLSVFLNWCIRVSYQHPLNEWGWQIVTHVQSVVHEIRPKSWTVTCALDRPLSYYDFPVRAQDFGWDISEWDDGIWDDDGLAKWSAGNRWSNNDRWR